MKKKTSYDANYISYLENGESAAVFIVRDVVTEIDTTNKWIDVIDLNCEKKHGQFQFDFIIAELFNRKITPIYPARNEMGDSEYTSQCKYITWLTATKDIENQRTQNVTGPKYLVISKLLNRNKGKWVSEDALWNTTFNQWVKPDWKTPSCVVRKRKRFLPPEKNDWYYHVDGVKELSQKQLEWINNNRDTIIRKIGNEGNAKIEYFSK